MEGSDSRTSSAPIATTIRMSASAKAPVPIRNPRSVDLAFALVPLIIESLARFDLGERRQFHLDDVGRQRCVAEIGRKLLSIAKRPLHETDHGLRLHFVLRSLIEQ